MPGHGQPRIATSRGYYPADLIVLGYLAVASLLLLASPRGIPGQTGLAVVHLALLAAVALLRLAPRERPALLRVVRHHYPLALVPLAYSDLAHLNRLVTDQYFDQALVRIDQALFGCQISQRLHALLPSSLISEYAHLSYLLYGLMIPAVALPLYWAARRAELRQFATTVVTSFATCFLVFILYPVRGPFHHFGPIAPAAGLGFFAELSHRLLSHASAQGTAFPSSHVAVAVAIWMQGRRLLPKLSLPLMVVAIGIFVGTVYGGFHYGADALVGLAAGVGLGLLGPRIHAMLLKALGMTPDIARLAAIARDRARPRQAVPVLVPVAVRAAADISPLRADEGRSVAGRGHGESSAPAEAAGARR